MTEEENVTAASRIKAGRAPGPDGIPPETVQWMTEKRPREVAKVLSGLYHQGTFPAQWNRARLVLVPKIKEGTTEIT